MRYFGQFRNQNSDTRMQNCTDCHPERAKRVEWVSQVGSERFLDSSLRDSLGMTGLSAGTAS